MPASPWSTQSCVPHQMFAWSTQSCVPRRQSWRRMASAPLRTGLWCRPLLWGRLSSLRPAFQPASAPFTHRPPHNPMPRHVGADQRVRPACSLLHRPLPPWSKPPSLPCRRSRRQSDTIPSCAGVPTPSSPHDCALHLQPLPCSHLRALRGLFFSVSSVSSVLCFSPCSPCSLWFAFFACPPCPLWFAFSVSSVVCLRITNP
jgi:hypothetical protein